VTTHRGGRSHRQEPARRSAGGARRAERPPRRLRPAVIVTALALLAAGGWAASGLSRSDDDRGAAGREPEAAARDVRLAWGPTSGELARARELVADWGAARLAGQVIVGRYHGTEPEEAAALVRSLHLAGVSITNENVTDEAQVRDTTAAVSRSVAADGRDFPAVIGVDQEGGTVAHLDGVATGFPAFAEAGAAIEADARAGRRRVRDAAYAAALELRALGFTWVFAPVADVTIGSSDPTIGSRSASSDPRVAAGATGAAVRGYNRAGVVSTTKHFPGHGAVDDDSHLVLPELDSSLAELRGRDLLPFRAAVRAGAPAVMISHVAVGALAPDRPASLAPEVYGLLADDLGFDGLTVTDSLGMGALSGLEKPAVQALLAGADLLLMPADTERSHATVTAAIRSGELPRERVEDAAATVIAVQMWQQRVAATRPVPADASERAEAAADALTESD